MISAGTVIVSILGSYFGIKNKLDGLSEVVKALHQRLDEFEEKFHKLDKEVGVHGRDITDLRAWRNDEGDSMKAFKMAKELLREDRNGRS